MDERLLGDRDDPLPVLILHGDVVLDVLMGQPPDRRRETALFGIGIVGLLRDRLEGAQQAVGVP